MDASDVEDLEDAEDEAPELAKQTHRPQWATRGISPRCLKDYIMDYAVGTRVFETEDPMIYREASSLQC